MLNLAIGKDPDSGEHFLMFTDMDTDERHVLAQFLNPDLSEAFQLYWKAIGGSSVDLPSTSELNKLLNGDAS